MAQMPASYLTEKIDDLRVGMARLDTSGGFVDLTPHSIRCLSDMARAAQAIQDEIHQWAGVTAATPASDIVDFA